MKFTHVIIAHGAVYLIANPKANRDGTAVTGKYVFLGDKDGRMTESCFPAPASIKDAVEGLFSLSRSTIIKL